MVRGQATASLTNVSVTRAGIGHLKNINLTIPVASHTVIIGENGSGKSTLLDVLSRDIKVSAGVVQLNDNDINAYSLPELAECRAYFKQQQRLDFDLTVYDVVKLGAINCHGDKKDQVLEVLQALELQELSAKLYTHLSGGEKQRVQIGRVLAQCWQAEGHICLLDEPMSSLDIRHQQLLLRVLLTLKEKGLTIVSVMHGLELVHQAADNVVILKSGEISSFGPTEQVFTSENIQKAFGIKWPIEASDDKLQT